MIGTVEANLHSGPIILYVAESPKINDCQAAMGMQERIRCRLKRIWHQLSTPGLSHWREEGDGKRGKSK